MVAADDVHNITVKSMNKNTFHKITDKIMKLKQIKRSYAFGMMLAVTTSFFALNAENLNLTTQSMDVTVQFITPEIVRVVKTPAGHTADGVSLVIVKAPEDVKTQCVKKNGLTTYSSSELSVVINDETGGISFVDPEGKRLLLDKDYGTSFSFDNAANNDSTYKIRSSFLLEADEPIYGIGQVIDGKFDRRNTSYHLQNENMFTYSPYFMSPTKGYAVYWDNYSISDFQDTPQDLSYTALGDCLDYYFIYGKTPSGVVADLRELTGKAPMLPLWAYGFFQSWCQYNTQDELLSALKKFRNLKVPVDCMVLDWRYWPEYNRTDSAWNSHSFDPVRFPDPKGMTDKIHAMNGKLMLVAWPGFGPKTSQYQELEPKGYIFPFDTWPPNSGAHPYDVYNDEARDIYWKYLDNGIFSAIGNDAWWLDSTEPDHINVKHEDYYIPTTAGTYRNVKNVYSLMHNKGIATHQKEQNKDKRVVILTRSGFIGQQRYGSNTWSGDVQSTWETLRNHIPAAQNYALMGIPNWNSDIGGYFPWIWNDHGKMKDGYPELYTRWMQFGTFCPMMRSHGIDLPREIWNFGNRGDKVFDAQEKMIKLRYRLLPYIYSTSWDVSANDGLFIRPLLMDFTEDRNVYDKGGQYMFGKCLLTSPVTEPGVNTWDVYLPEGASWWDFWTNEKHDGGQTVNKSVPIEIIPLYVKAGSIIPFGPDVQYSTERPWDDLEIRIYPGADASFTLYEDENDNYNYENGTYSTILFDWDDAAKTLTIGDREGSFPGMLKSRKFRVTLVDADTPSGDKKAKKSRLISYKGKALNINNF